MRPNLGRIFIKEYPAGYATINTLKAHLDKLQLTKDFIPDIILIDYADIMRSTRKYDSLRHELKLIYEELRSWATEIGIPIWTASQINREGSNHDVIELKNIPQRAVLSIAWHKENRNPMLKHFLRDKEIIS